LVDEVLAVGDAQFQKKCLGKMSEVAKEGRTVLFVSHNMGAVEKLCGKTLYLNGGEIASFKDSNNVISQYISEVSAVTATPLVQRRDRSGSGVIRATSVEVRSAGAAGVAVVRTGETAVVEIGYEVMPGVSPDNVTVAVGIDDMTNNRIVTLWSKFNNEIFRELSRRHKFVCQIPELSLRTGSYFLHVFIESNGIIADYVVNAHRFHVDYGKFYESGIEPSGDQGYILQRHQWSVI
jgi:lipopolysaccharide transport system ATP-binding protein